MTTTIVLLIATLGLLIAAECWVAFWLHRKIRVYKDMYRKACTPDFEGVERVLKMLRQFGKRYYPEGNYNIDLACHCLATYCQRMRYQAKMEILKQQKDGKQAEKNAETLRNDDGAAS